MLKFHFALAYYNCSAVGICPAQIKEGIKILTCHFSMRHVVGSYVWVTLTVMHYVIHLFTHLIGFFPSHCPFKHVHDYVCDLVLCIVQHSVVHLTTNLGPLCLLVLLLGSSSSARNGACSLPCFFASSTASLCLMKSFASMMGEWPALLVSPVEWCLIWQFK